MNEQRKDVRTGVEIEMNVTWPGKGTAFSSSFNYSHGGVLTKNPFADVPAAGTVMTVQVRELGNGKEAPILGVTVVRASADEIAFQFVERG